jgi:hypothetical protein|tara:strand:- start:5953 stop:6393 length:441 start_codon:yes stop_codon:yes gene_type:complete
MTNSFKGFKRGEMITVVGGRQDSEPITEIQNMSLSGCCPHEHQVVALSHRFNMPGRHMGKTSFLMSAVFEARRNGEHEKANAILKALANNCPRFDFEGNNNFDKFTTLLTNLKMEKIKSTFEETGSLESLKKPLVKAIKEGMKANG